MGRQGAQPLCDVGVALIACLSASSFGCRSARGTYVGKARALSMERNHTSAAKRC